MVTMGVMVITSGGVKNIDSNFIAAIELVIAVAIQMVHSIGT